MAFLKQKKFAEAERDCTKMLALVDGGNKLAYEGEEKAVRALRVKTFFRRGMARQAMGWYEQALGDYDSALVLEPQNKRAKTSRQQLARAPHRDYPAAVGTFQERNHRLLRLRREVATR